MSKEREYLEKSVINLTVENAKLKIELEESETTKSRYWKWYSEEKDKSDSLQKQLDAIKNIEVVADAIESKNN